MTTSTPARGGKSACAFDPTIWLTQFERVGGAFTVTDKLNLFIAVHGQSDAQLSQARHLIVDLTDDQEAAIVAHLRAAQAAAMGEC